MFQVLLKLNNSLNWLLFIHIFAINFSLIKYIKTLCLILHRSDLVKVLLLSLLTNTPLLYNTIHVLNLSYFTVIVSYLFMAVFVFTQAFGDEITVVFVSVVHFDTDLEKLCNVHCLKNFFKFIEHCDVVILVNGTVK